MQAFLKDKNKIVVNSMIFDDEKQDMINFANSASENGVLITKLYDTEGNVSGVMFKLVKE
jgi:hypothetical protein